MRAGRASQRPAEQMTMAPHEGWSDWVKTPAGRRQHRPRARAPRLLARRDRADHGRQLDAPVRPRPSSPREILTLPSPIEELKMALAKTLLFCLVSPISAAFASAAAAQAYPNKPITLVVPFAPGGFVHTVALMYQESLGKSARPAGGRPEQARRERQHRGRIRREVRARRLYAVPADREHPDHQPAPVQERALRRAEGLRAGGTHRQHVEHVRGQPAQRHQDAQGSRRQGAREPRHRLVRLVGHRAASRTSRASRSRSRPTSSSSTCRTKASRRRCST